MSNDYNDICNDSRPEDLSEAESATPSAPPVPTGTGDGASSINYDPMDYLRQPAEDFDSAVPVQEITKGEIQIGKREVKMYPQQFVYNFPGIYLQPNSRFYQVGLMIPPAGTLGNPSIRKPPSTNPADYKANESVKVVAALQDPLRFVAGKIFYQLDRSSPGVRAEEAHASFEMLNTTNMLFPRNNTGYYPGLGFEQDPKLSLWIGSPQEDSIEFDGPFFKSLTIRSDVKALDFYPRFFEGEITEQSALFIEGQEFLEKLIPGDAKVFTETRFKTHAAFHKSELNYMESFPKFYAEVKTTTPDREHPAEQRFNHERVSESPSEGYYQVNSAERKNLKNIYEGFLLSSATIEDGYRPGFDFDPETYEECEEEVVVEKYPANKVDLISNLNGLILANLEEQDEDSRGIKRWIDVNSDGFAEVSFRMPNFEESNWARIFKISGADVVLLSALDKMHTDSETANYDTLYAYHLEMSVLDEESPDDDDFYTGPDYYSPNDKTAFNYRPRKLDRVFHYLEEWMEDNFTAGQTDRENEINMKQKFTRREFPLLFDGAPSMDGTQQSFAQSSTFIMDAKESVSIAKSDFWENVYPFDGRLLRGWRALRPKQLFSTKPCPSEIVAFRVEKVNTYSGQVLKEFYFFNNPETTDFTFIDNEVSIGGRYKYNIYAINLVAGMNYSYSNPNRVNDIFIDGVLSPYVFFDFTTAPFHTIVETPFFTQTVTMIDLPPVSPSVALHKMTSEQSEEAVFRYIFTPRIDKALETPIPILNTDTEVISKMSADQRLIHRTESEEGLLRYSSDTKPTHFEMFVLDTPPRDYEDFSRAKHYSTPFSEPYFNFIAPENQDLYVTFRTRDLGGISNPSHMFRFRYNKYGDGSYHEFEVFEPSLETYNPTITCERFLSLKLATLQSAYNFEIDRTNPDEVRGVLEESAPRPIDVKVGLSESDQTVWGKTFKVRVRSVSTGRMIDFNFSYALDPADDNAPPASVTSRARGCESELEQKNDTIRANSRTSVSNIRQNTGARPLRAVIDGIDAHLPGAQPSRRPGDDDY